MHNYILNSCHHMHSSLIMFAQFLLITNQQLKSSPISVWTPLCAESKISFDLLLTQFYLSNRWSKQLLSNTNVVDLFFLYNFYFGQISSCCAKNLVLGAPKLNLFCPKTRRFRVWKPEVPVLLCFTYSGTHTSDCVDLLLSSLNHFCGSVVVQFILLGQK